MQILADQQGRNGFAGEQDCSLQRNNQKVLEENYLWRLGKPCVSELVIQLFGLPVCRLYENAGTGEFLLDEAKGEFY